jgi:L1 cell adhesion molecule like protein
MPRGVPQIEVAYDIDANGILTVSASEKSTGKSSNIKITNDKGRLSKDEIERMVSEAEQFKAEDEAVRERIEAKNTLENYCFHLKSSLNDVKDKLTEDDLKAIEEKVSETLEWLENNDNDSETKDTFETKKKEVEAVANPIMMKLYQQDQKSGMPESPWPSGDANDPMRGFTGSNDSSPEEVD